MKVEYINPFVHAAFSVLKEILDVDIKRDRLKLKVSPIPTLGVAVVLGITGDVEGRVLYDMKKDTALKIAEVMNDEKLPEFDELVRATINELGNIITGRAVSALNDLGYTFDLTPPSLFSGDNMDVSTLVDTLVVPLETPFGTVVVNVALRGHGE